MLMSPPIKPMVLPLWHPLAVTQFIVKYWIEQDVVPISFSHLSLVGKAKMQHLRANKIV